MHNYSGNVCPMCVQCLVDLHVLYMYMVNGKQGPFLKNVIESVCNKVYIHSRDFYMCLHVITLFGISRNVTHALPAVNEGAPGVIEFT